MTLYNLKRLALDIVYPNRCPFCDGFIPYNEYHCPKCPEKLDRYKGDDVIENIERAFTVFEYNERSRDFITAIKEGGTAYAVGAAAKFIYDILVENKVDVDMITCVPSSRGRMRLRGYNPPGLIADELCAMTGVKRVSGLLVKTRESALQKELNRAERRENLRGAFALGKGKRVFGSVLIIDDVRTTGSTLSQAAEVLVKAGAERVYAATVAGTACKEMKANG